MDTMAAAKAALRAGDFVMLHDGEGRENEADLLLLAEKATPAKVRRMRQDAGGLVCLSTDAACARRLSLPFAADLLPRSLSGMGKGRMPYGDKSAFSISINHRRTFTGITDNDRALTISEFGRLVKRKGGKKEFSKNFRAVGHVFLLVGRGLDARKGHTELSLELARHAGAAPAVALCEMLSDSGRAASKKEAAAYAKKHGIPFISGGEVLAWSQKAKK